MSNPYAPPSVNESKAGHTFLWQIAGYALIALGLTIPVIWLTLVRGLPIGLGGIIALLNLSAGIVMVALSLPAQTESEKRRKRLLLWLIPVLAILIMGGTLVVHTVRLTHQVRQAQQEAMYQRDLAQKAFEQAELQQRRSSANPASEQEPNGSSVGDAKRTDANASIGTFGHWPSFSGVTLALTGPPRKPRQLKPRCRRLRVHRIVLPSFRDR